MNVFHSQIIRTLRPNQMAGRAGWGPGAPVKQRARASRHGVAALLQSEGHMLFGHVQPGWGN